MLEDDYGSAREIDCTGYNAVRCGRVTARRLTKVGAQVKVTYDDRGVESDWIPVGQSNSKGHVFYNPPPQLGDQAIVLHLPTGIEKGVMVCTTSTLRNPSFTPRSVNSVSLQALDGSYFEYDPDKGCLNINGITSVYLNSKGEIRIITGGDLNATVSGNLNATVTGNVEVSCTNLDATASGEVTIQGPAITLKGPVTVTGNLTVQGSTTTVQNLNILGTETGGGGT